MSLAAQLRKAIAHQPGITSTALAAMFPGYRQKQIQCSLSDNVKNGKLTCVRGRPLGKGMGTEPGTYFPVEQQWNPEPLVRRVSSVWELGAMA